MYFLQLELWQIAVIFAPLLIVFWAIWHASKQNFTNPTERFYWIVACSLLPVIGALLYIIFGIPRAKKSSKI